MPSPMKEIGELPNGYRLFVQDNDVGGRTYFSDEVPGGVMVWDTSLVDASTMLAVLTAESKAMLQEKIAASIAKKQAGGSNEQ